MEREVLTVPQNGTEELMKIVKESQEVGGKAVLGFLSMQCQNRRQEAIDGRKRLKEEMQRNIAAAGSDHEAARKAKKDGEKAIDDFINGIDPFAKPYALALDIAQRFTQRKNINWRDPGKDVSAVMDEIDVPVEEKLKLLYIMQENAMKNLYPSGLDVKGAADTARLNKMGRFQEMYGVGKREEVTAPNGDVSIQLDDDIFAHNFGNMTNCFMLMFSDKYKNEKNQSIIKRSEAMDIAKFCNQKIAEYHLQILSGKIETGRQPTENQQLRADEQNVDPYFGGMSFRSVQQKFNEQKELLQTFLASAEGKNSTLSKELSGAKLFGRGSEQFDNIQTSYKDLQDALRQHLADPSAESLKNLEAQAKLLQQRTDLYLDFKHKQIDSKEISGTKTPDGKGGFIYRAGKSSTQRRMDFAQTLKGELAKVDAYIQKNQPKVAEADPQPGQVMI